MGKIYGYARVSTKEQRLDRQVLELEKYVKNNDDIIIDEISGRDFNRPNYQALKRFVRRGDTIYIKSLDRFGRNKNMIKEELQYFKDKGVYVRCLDIPTTLINYADYGQMQNAIFDMVNNILIEVLGMMYEQELSTTRVRQLEGIAAAKKAGKHLGRPRTPRPKGWILIYERWQDGDISAVAAMQELGLKPATFYRMVKNYEEELKAKAQEQENHAEPQEAALANGNHDA